MVSQHNCTWKMQDNTCVYNVGHYSGLSFLERVFRVLWWCFYCDADLIIYLYTKLNPDYDWPTYLFRYQSLAFPLTIVPQAGGCFCNSSLDPAALDLLSSPPFFPFLSSLFPSLTCRLSCSHFSCYGEAVGPKMEDCICKTAESKG